MTVGGGGEKKVLIRKKTAPPIFGCAVLIFIILKFINDKKAFLIFVENGDFSKINNVGSVGGVGFGKDESLFMYNSA